MSGNKAADEYVDAQYVEPGHDVTDSVDVFSNRKLAIKWEFRSRFSGPEGRWTKWLGEDKPYMDRSKYEVRRARTRG